MPEDGLVKVIEPGVEVVVDDAVVVVEVEVVEVEVVVVVLVEVVAVYWKVAYPVAPFESVAVMTYVPVTHDEVPPT